MSSASDPWTQLRLLREVTRSTGSLHEAHVVQLKYWPRLAMPDSRRSEFSYDHDGRALTFRVALTWWKRPARNQKARLDGLARSVRDMLGEDMLVRVVRSDGAPIYESAGTPPASCPPQN